jgi:homoserine kinase type II
MSVRGFLSKQDAAAILAGYDLGDLRHCTYIERGYVNEKWLLETDMGRFLLKRRHASQRKLGLVQAQHALVRYLRRAGYPAPALACTLHGNWLVVHGGEVYELQEYIPGHPFDPAKPGHLTAAARMLCAYHGVVMGFDHKALHQPVPRYGCSALRTTVGALAEEWRLPVPPELELLLGQLVEHVRDLEGRYLAFGPLPELVIHGDYHGANLIFRGDQIVGVVDYDLAHWCSRMMEVAEALIAFCTDPGLQLRHIVYSGALDLERVSSFLRAYQEEASLSEVEIRALPDLVRSIWLCAALDPPLEPRLSLQDAPDALPEILALAHWAVANQTKLVEACLSGR